MEDVSKAYRAFDMTQMEKDMKEGRPLNPVDLAKVEKVILDGKMPQAKYYLVHWGASFNDAKKEVALSWDSSYCRLDLSRCTQSGLRKSVVSRHPLIGRQHRFMCQLSWPGYRWR